MTIFALFSPRLRAPRRKAARATLLAAGLAVLLDDRDGTTPGEKFVEAELLGCPIRLTIGKRTLPDGPLEGQVRRGRERNDVPLHGAAAAIVALLGQVR